jgi:DNA-binding NarL/FixJ family response regulator
MPINVAIVDDNTSYREGLRYLMDFSSDFTCIGSYYSGKDLLTHLPPIPPDVILMDIEMPDVDGIICTTELKTRPSYQATNIIVLSVLENTDKVMEAILAGASGYLLKSEPPEYILAAIRQVHGGGAPMSADIARKVLDRVRLSKQSPQEKIDLNPRELEVLNGLVEGLSYKMIGDKYAMATDTVRGYIKRIYEKLQVHSRSEAITKALRNNIV